MYITLPLWWGVWWEYPLPPPVSPLIYVFWGRFIPDNPLNKIFQKKFMEQYPLFYKMRRKVKIEFLEKFSKFRNCIFLKYFLQK